MSKIMDPSIDWLADAALTPEQRQAWNVMRNDLFHAQSVIEDLEAKLKKIQEGAAPEIGQAILTRPEFNREVARMLAFDERYGGNSSVLYFNFENLDAISARLGKSVTNATVREIGNLLIKNMRNSDIIGRLAPDEFGILLVRCDNVQAWKKGQILASVLYDAFSDLRGNKLDVNISYGAYTFGSNEDVTTGLKQAAQSVTRATKD